MKVYQYNRVSTDQQTLEQQRFRINGFLQSRGLTITDTIADEGVSGKISYKQRNLSKLLDMMDEGDMLIVSELSRLGRSMCDISKLVNDDLKPRKIRLVIVSMNLDLQCDKMRAIDEMIINNFAFAAQTERELLCDRVNAELGSIKNELKVKGTHVTRRGKNKGRVITKLGSDTWTVEQMQKAGKMSGERKTDEAKRNPHNVFFFKFITNYEKNHGKIFGRENVEKVVHELNFLDAKTSTGMEFTVPRYYSMLKKCKSIFVCNEIIL
jgi:DNA invertase Pin-like site-specific DNA recombinase